MVVFPLPEALVGGVLAEIARRHGRTPRQDALNFLTRHSGIFTIPKTTHPDRVKENSGGVGWELTADELAAINYAFPPPDHDTPLGMI